MFSNRIGQKDMQETGHFCATLGFTISVVMGYRKHLYCTFSCPMGNVGDQFLRCAAGGGFIASVTNVVSILC